MDKRLSSAVYSSQQGDSGPGHSGRQGRFNSPKERPMKFAARDGSAARTLAHTTLPSAHRRIAETSPGWYAMGATPAPGVRPISQPQALKGDASGSSANGRSRSGATSTVTFLRGQEIFTPGRGRGLVYIVRSGCVRLYKILPEGRSINLGLLGPNTVFTQEETSDGLASGAIAEAIVDSTISVVDTDSLGAIIAQSPELAAAMVNGMRSEERRVGKECRSRWS